jgi:hypothetical protein
VLARASTFGCQCSIEWPLARLVNWVFVGVSMSVSMSIWPNGAMDTTKHTGLDQTGRLDEPLVLDVTTAARLLGISRALAYELAARGELPVLRLGR